MGEMGKALEFVRQSDNFLPERARSFDAEIPVLRISRSILSRQADLFLTKFPGTVSYAVKANAHPHVIRVFHEVGIQHFDVASLNEMAIVRSVIPDAILHYHNPIRSGDEIRRAIQEFDCKRFSLDHMSELEKLDQYIATPNEIELAIRFRIRKNSSAVQNFGTKFGTSIAKSVEILKQARSLGYRVGLTFHPGSQTLDAQPYADQILRAAQIAGLAECDLAFLNVGGGFPSRYANLDIPPLGRFFEKIEQTCRDAFKGRPLPQLECEPGRALVAPAACLDTRIKAVRRDQQELFLNDGIYGGLAEASLFPTMFPNYVMPGRAPLSQAEQLIEWTMYGPTCDPVDVLPRKLLLPEALSDGEIIRFLGLGAYSTATATNFNGYGKIRTMFVK